MQADIWTGRLRENFNQFINQKEAARGWVYPFKMGISKNNNPANYNFNFTGKWDELTYNEKEELRKRRPELWKKLYREKFGFND